MKTHWQLPPSLLQTLDRLPSQRAVALLIRHSVRDPLPPGDAGYTLPITEEGQRLAQNLGERFGSRLKTLHTSPLPRCVQTAEALRRGSQTEIKITLDRLLGDPGVYVLDGREAQRHWQELGHEKVMEYLVAGSDVLSGMAHPSGAARFLVQHMLRVADAHYGIHVFVTHDSLITATVARMIGEPLGLKDWPWYLEAGFFWKEESGISAVYRELERHSIASPLCRLEEDDVIDFARREIAATIGLESEVRFFLAGGAFKTLLTGRPPRDLDLWTPSEDDRNRLLCLLERRGAHRLADQSFADVFSLHGRVIEIPHKTEPTRLEERLARFDLALSAVGVEYSPKDGWRAVIHPLAKESVCRREILLLKPLVNWKYALVTLERAHRYAEELGYTLPSKEEEEVWRVFSEQPLETRLGMIARYERSGFGLFGLKEQSVRFSSSGS